METTQIRQGDQYPLYFKLTDASGTILTPSSNVSNVSISIGNKTKKWDSGTGLITYDTTSQSWRYPLSQAETLNLREGRYDVLIRVKFTSTNICSTTVAPLEVLKSIDRETL